MRVLGIDAATHTGLVLLDGEDHRAKSIQVNSKGFSRLQSIANEFQKTLLFWKPDVAVIEGYGNTPKMGVSSFVTVVEVATLLRLSLFQSQIAWIEVPPTTLKKWTTGNGNAKKPDMARAVEQKWNFKNGNDDIIDAYALARLGQVEPEQLFKLKGVQLVDGAKKIA